MTINWLLELILNLQYSILFPRLIESEAVKHDTKSVCSATERYPTLMSHGTPDTVHTKGLDQ